MTLEDQNNELQLMLNNGVFAVVRHSKPKVTNAYLQAFANAHTIAESTPAISLEPTKTDGSKETI